MNTVALIVTCISGTCAFAYLLAGYVALLSRDQREVDELQRRYRELTSRGILAPFRSLSWIRRESLPLSQIVVHWRTRSEIRRLIYLGFIFLVIALISAHFSSLPR